MNCSVFCILTFWEVVPQTGIPCWGCATAANTSTPWPKSLGKDVSCVKVSLTGRGEEGQKSASSQHFEG